MSKVYCKNCKWDRGSSAFCQYRPDYKYEEVGSEFCGSAKKKIRTKEGEKLGIVFPAYKWELNKAGECPYYKESRIYRKKKQIEKKKNDIKNFIIKWLRKLKIKK